MRCKMKAALFAALMLVFGSRSLPQNCQALATATPEDLVSFLEDTTKNKSTDQCVRLAMKKLGEVRFQPAIPTLIKLLDFKPTEDVTLMMHPPYEFKVYPATAALREIGKASLPALLGAITNGSRSQQVRSNALLVFMSLHSDNKSAG